MVDPGAAQQIVKLLNRWYRKRAKPRGTIDHYYRGTRMSYTKTYRRVASFISLLMLSIAALPWFVPDIFTNKSPLETLALRAGWAALVVVPVLLLLHAFREYAVVTDDALVKSDLFGRETRMAWKEICFYKIKPDQNKIVFLKTGMKSGLTMSLAYDGWRDFLEMAAKHLDQSLYLQFTFALANLDAKGKTSRSTKKSRWAKWLSSGRSR
jgi:hypothetical protein